MKINAIFYSICVAAVAVPLGACAPGNVVASRDQDAGAIPLLRQLHMQYGELALRKQSEGNYDAARYFDGKAVRAGNGGRVWPDRPADPDAMKEYDRLTAAIDDGDGAPAVRARAQVMFDCWLDERTQAVDTGDIEACKQEFDRALKILSGARVAVGSGSS